MPLQLFRACIEEATHKGVMSRRSRAAAKPSVPDIFDVILAEEAEAAKPKVVEEAKAPEDGAVAEGGDVANGAEGAEGVAAEPAVAEAPKPPLLAAQGGSETFLLFVGAKQSGKTTATTRPKPSHCPPVALPRSSTQHM